MHKEKEQSIALWFYIYIYYVGVLMMWFREHIPGSGQRLKKKIKKIKLG
jgi:hypothetical protein